MRGHGEVLVVLRQLQPAAFAGGHVEFGEQGRGNTAVEVVLPGGVLPGQVFGLLRRWIVPDQALSRAVNMVEFFIGSGLQFPHAGEKFAGL